MSWHYAARKRICKTLRPDGEQVTEIYYDLVEVYPDLPADEIPVHTENSATILGETPQELAKWLRNAADDIETFPVIEGGTIEIT